MSLSGGNQVSPLSLPAQSYPLPIECAPPPRPAKTRPFFASFFLTFFDPNLPPRRPRLGPLLGTQIGPKSAQDRS